MTPYGYVPLCTVQVAEQVSNLLTTACLEAGGKRVVGTLFSLKMRWLSQIALHQ